MDATSSETTSTPDFDADWAEWDKDRSPDKLHSLVTKLSPVIDAALRPLGNNASPVIRGRAKLVAAKAIKGYNPQAGAKLSTFVTSHLRSILRDAPAINDPMPIPTRQRQEMAMMSRAANDFSDKLGREPSDEELATVLGMPHKKIIKLRNSIRSRIPLSVHDEQDDEEGGNPDIAAHTHQPFEDWQDAVYHGLGDIDKVIFMHRTGYRHADKLSNQDIAAKVGLTPGAVSQRAAKLQARLDEFNG